MARKATGQTTKMTRIPIRFEEQVKNYVTKLKNEEESGQTWTKGQSGKLAHELIADIELLNGEISDRVKRVNKKMKELKTELKRMNLYPQAKVRLAGLDRYRSRDEY